MLKGRIYTFLALALCCLLVFAQKEDSISDKSNGNSKPVVYCSEDYVDGCINEDIPDSLTTPTVKQNVNTETKNPKNNEVLTTQGTNQSNQLKITRSNWTH